MGAQGHRSSLEKSGEGGRAGKTQLQSKRSHVMALFILQNLQVLHSGPLQRMAAMIPTLYSCKQRKCELDSEDSSCLVRLHLHSTFPLGTFDFQTGSTNGRTSSRLMVLGGPPDAAVALCELPALKAERKRRCGSSLHLDRRPQRGDLGSESRRAAEEHGGQQGKGAEEEVEVERSSGFWLDSWEAEGTRKHDQKRKTAMGRGDELEAKDRV